MRISFQIIQTYPCQSVPTIFINFESRKYFFNAPETLQRFAGEHWVRTKKGSRIFFTQLNTDHITGVFGLLLTLYETKLAYDVQLFGPPGFTDYMDSIRFLFGMRILPYSIFDFSNSNKKLLGIKNPAFMEQVLSLPGYNKLFWNMNEYLFTRQKESAGDINDPEKSIQDGSYKDENIEIHPIILLPSPSDRVAISYVCISNSIPGKVNQQKVKALKVPHKFISKILQARELEVEGILYKASDFQDPAEPVPVLIIVDCPGVSYIDSLLNDNWIKKFMGSESDNKEQVLQAVIHIVPEEVLLNEKYAEFLKKLPESARQIFVNENLKDKSELIQTNQSMEEEKKEEEKALEDKSYQLKYRHFLFTNLLAKYFPDYFPILDDIKRTAKYNLETLFPFLKYSSTNQKLVEFIMSPTKSIGFSKASLSFEKHSALVNFEEQAKFVKKYKKIIEKQKPKIDEIEKEEKLFENCDPEMVFLGTGSMKPSNFRNVSAIYLRFRQQNDIGFLLDCGEGTYFQLLNHYGYEKTRELLKNLSVVFITHVHADHNLGLMKILSERQKILREENITKDAIFVVIPYNCATWLLRYSVVEELDYKIVFNQHINVEKNEVDISKSKRLKTEEAPEKTSEKKGPKSKVTCADGEEEYEYYDDPNQNKNVLNNYETAAQNVELFEKFLLENVGIVGFKTISVNHCPQACAVLIEHKDGWKYVYSGDTRPCQRMVDQAGSITILVHESTFAAGMQKIAEHKMHSTEKEAIEIGMKMKAWRTVLTHFSQRFAKNSADFGSFKKPGTVMEDESKQGFDVDQAFYDYSKRNTIRVVDHFRMRFSQLIDLPIKSNCILKMFPAEE